ncbi:hypothetical protein HXP44_29225 [Streptomyces sioyaensis]|nr:hypothetical protein [Streptomyces sioyaensis]MBM4796017.1 hypothetical protein [Streptomyces sioyaensis]
MVVLERGVSGEQIVGDGEAVGGELFDGGAVNWASMRFSQELLAGV